MRKLNILIACEESQAECLAFRELGHNAYSCDLQPVQRYGNKSWHIQGDVTPLLEGGTRFKTQDGKWHQVNKWHLIVAHPPCTYLCKVSAVWYRIGGKVDPERHQRMLRARQFFYKCLNAQAIFVAVENPLPMAAAGLPKPDCYIQPSWFGVKYTKKTLYWLRNLPPLIPEIIYPNPKQFVHCSRGKYRSRTFPQVAAAMARQWSEYICDRTRHNKPR